MIKSRWQKPAVGLGLVILIAASVRLWYLLEYAALSDWLQLTVDNYYYSNWALTFLEGELSGDTTYFRAPLYSWMLALTYWIGGAGLWSARIFGLLVGVASAAMTFLLTWRLTKSHTASLVAGLLHSVYPVSLYFGAEIVADPLSVLFLQVSFYFLLRWSENFGSGANLVLAAVFLGLSCITRPTGLVLIPLYLLLAAWPAGYRMKNTLIVVATLGLTILPVTIRNAAVGGEFELIASQGGINLYLGNNPRADGISAIMPEPYGYNWQLADLKHIAETQLGEELKPGEVSSYWVSQARNWMVEEPAKALRLYVAKLHRFVHHAELSNNRPSEPYIRGITSTAYNPLTFGVLFPIACIGIALSWRDKRLKALCAFTVWLVLWSSLFFVVSRFRLPVLPLIFMGCGLGVMSLFRLRHYSRAQVIMAITVAIAAGVITFAPPLIDSQTQSEAVRYTTRGLYYYRLGDYDRALTEFRLARAADTAFTEVNLNIGNVFFRKGQADSARYYFVLEKNLHPQRAKSYVNLASLELVSGNPKSAEYQAAQAISHKPHDEVAHMLMIRAAGLVRSPDEVYQVALKGAEATDTSLELVNDAAALLSDLERFDLSKEIALVGLTAQRPPLETDSRMSEPDYIDIFRGFAGQKARLHFQLGYLAGRAGELRESIEHSQQAIALDSTLTPAYVNLISGYVSLRELDKARATFELALSKFPSDPSLAHLRQALQ